jgi:flagellar motor switch protein FliM
VADGPSVGYSNQATSTQVDGAPGTGTPRRRRGEARSYDFRRPVRLAREHSHLLKVATSTFGRQATTVLTTGLRVVCSLGMREIEELSYDEYLTGMPEASVCAVLTLDPLPGKALLTFEQATLLAMLDHLLGGPGTEQQPDRPLTDIESSLVRHLLQRLLRELAYALEPISPTTPEVLGLESNAQFVQAAAPTDPVVVARMDVVIGQRTSTADLCFPYAMLAPALQVVSTSDDQRERAQQRILASALTTQRLNDVGVDVAVRFSPLRLPSSEIGRLTVGDVLTLGHRTSTPLTVTSANSTFALAMPGSSGKRLAALIVGAPQRSGAS